MRFLIWTTLCVLVLLSPVHAKQIAIVIDDIGYHRNDMAALHLPGAVTYSVLPFTPYAAHFAQQAGALDKEVLLHAPMQAINGKALGPGGLTMDMSKEAFQHELRKALASLPNARGVNNHMGSLLTQQNAPMSWTMEVLKEQDLFFLDSKTTPNSKAQTIAGLYGVSNIARHVFLDNITTEQQLRYRFEQLKTLADKYDYAVAIAHPYPETFAFLQQALQELEGEGFQLVPLSQLVQQRTIRLAQADKKSVTEEE
ncbi:hypothetical protein CWC05_00725 [Pseudoalteromonas ruthenica]|uniref:Divergent polysaccharide deacetylase family protein n=1 Tax=Pseudoalteromonas ruthenica TaxID=151081 RepID=A0A5S3Z9I5_9GAMM|nr:divergent polysaccharide deacetylase family protein [Pseudoalteromonas ruthenica]TLX51252.1 hypothetical protein CWC31_07955 [Pseudoalteromonas ruthenica]TMP88909.1 hypothetical protein CWC05_00725 [Pseudoalteromonas ruthenica]